MSRSKNLAVVLVTALAVASCSPSPNPARMANAGVTLGGKVYLLGGLDSRGRIMRSVVEYDPSTSTWTGRASLPQPVALAAAAATEDAIYVVGGRSSSDILADVLVYDPATDAWDELQPMTTPRWSHMATIVDRKLYVMGGIAGTGRSRQTLDSVEILDLETGTWTVGEPLPGPVHSSAVAVLDGKIFILGGRQGTGSSGRASEWVFVFDPVVGSWDVPQPMSQARTGPSAAMLDGRIYVVGGAASDAALSSIEIYDPATDSWISGPALSTPRTAHTVALVGDELLVFGGASSPTGGVLSEIETIRLGGGG